MFRMRNRRGASRLGAGLLVAAMATIGVAALASPASAAGPAATLDVSPQTQTITAGQQGGGFVAMVADADGNPVQGVRINFTITGPGQVQDSGAAQTTDQDGFASGGFTTQATDSGSGDINFEADGLTATTEYTVVQPSSNTPAASVSLALEHVGDGVDNHCTAGTTTTESCAIVDGAETSYADKADATVKDSSGTLLAGVSVTFTATHPFIGDAAAGHAQSVSDATYTVTTNSNGVARVGLGSTKVGDQVLSAKAGSVTSNHTTVTYTSDLPAATTVVTPKSTTIAAPASRNLTATVTDEYGNPVAGDTVTFTQSGPGALNHSSATTGAAGTASVSLVTTNTTSAGSGSVSATDGPTGDVADYTVTAPNKVAAVSASLSSGAKVGTTASASSKATNAAGGAAAGATLRFVITGAFSASGNAVSAANGIAKFSFVPSHAGHITVTVSYPTDSTVLSVTKSGAVAKGQPSTTLTQASPQKKSIRDTATISVKKAGISVDFYQRLANGSLKLRGSSDTNARGVAVLTVTKLTSGSQYAGVAKVASSQDYNGPKSKVVTTKVK